MRLQGAPLRCRWFIEHVWLWVGREPSKGEGDGGVSHPSYSRGLALQPRLGLAADVVAAAADPDVLQLQETRGGASGGGLGVGVEG